MIVSQFAVGYNAYTKQSTHHRILLTNLSANSYRFRLSLRVREPNVHLSSQYSVERHSIYSVGTFQPPINYLYRGDRTFSVGSHETVRIRIRPFDVPNWDKPSGSMEMLGYVDLSIPTQIVDFAGNVEAQGDDPVPVLLYARQIDFTTSEGYHNAAEVSVATGQAENEITPDQPFGQDIAETPVEIITSNDDATAAVAARGMHDDLAGRLEDPRTLGLVLSYLGHFGGESRNRKAINKALKDAGHDVRLKED